MEKETIQEKVERLRENYEQANTDANKHESQAEVLRRSAKQSYIYLEQAEKELEEVRFDIEISEASKEGAPKVRDKEEIDKAINDHNPTFQTGEEVETFCDLEEKWLNDGKYLAFLEGKHYVKIEDIIEAYHFSPDEIRKPQQPKQEQEKYPMCKDQLAQIDCRIEDCKFHKGGSCTNISPAITLNESGKSVCWTKGMDPKQEPMEEYMEESEKTWPKEPGELTDEEYNDLFYNWNRNGKNTFVDTHEFWSNPEMKPAIEHVIQTLPMETIKRIKGID